VQIEKRSRYRDANRNPWSNTLRIPHRTAAKLHAIAAALEVNKGDIAEQIIEAAINADATREAIADRAVGPMDAVEPCNLERLEIREGTSWRVVDQKLSKGWEVANG
jgi:hypothetical protein